MRYRYTIMNIYLNSNDHGFSAEDEIDGHFGSTTKINELGIKGWKFCTKLDGSHHSRSGTTTENHFLMIREVGLVEHYGGTINNKMSNLYWRVIYWGTSTKRRFEEGILNWVGV